MDLLNNLTIGFQTSLSLINLWYAFLGAMLGTLIGAFVIGFLADGLVMMGVSEFWQMVIKGIVIIVAVIIDQMQNRMQQKAAVVAQKAVIESK